MGEYWGMRKNSFIVKRFFIALALMLATTVSVLASENVISSVIISKSKIDPQGYELNIDSTQAVQYKSRIDSDGNVVFDLKNSTLAPNMGTIYDDVVDIDNVTVKQLDKNKVRIYVSGADARNTELVFVNSLFETASESAKKININRPISEYKSTSLHNNDLEYATDEQEWDDNSFNLYHFSTIVLSELKNGASGKVLILLMLFAIAAMLIKTLSAKLAQEKEPLIGLNNSKYSNNEAQIGTLGTIKALQNTQIDNSSNRSDTLKQAQIELAKAHQKYQQYIQNKYQNLQKPKSIDVDTLKKSIALNQYQKSTQNPYKNQEVIKLNGLNNGFDNQEKFKGQIPPRPKMRTNKEFTSPYIKKTNNFIDTNIQKNVPKTNMKFLESVSKIYEHSGRGDLAQELKNSISKTKQTI